MENKTKDLYGNEKTPLKLSVQQFFEYSKNVKSIYSNIGFFTISFFLLAILTLLIPAMQYLKILNVSDIVTYVIAIIILLLFILMWIRIFKKIIRVSKNLYLDKILIIDEKLKNELQSKQKWYSFKVTSMILATFICCVLGVFLIVRTEANYPDNSGYILLSVILMFLMIIIPLFLAIYFYSDIYIYNYIDNQYNFD